MSKPAPQHADRWYALLFAAHPLPMWVFDPETLRFLEVNEAAIRQYGYSREEFLELTLSDIRPSEDVRQLLDAVAEPRAARFSPPRVWRHRRKDGTVFDAEVTAEDIALDGRAARVVVAQDVSVRNRLEAQLLQAQKMEAIGRLAGGVAHDFNNILGVILGYGDRLLRRLPAHEQRDVREILRAADRAAGLTRQLLSFSRKQHLMPRVLDLNDVVRDMSRLLLRLIGEDVHLVSVLSDGLGRVKADRSRLEQVVMNLAVNARDAMPRGGKLTIETASEDLDAAYASVHAGVQPGRYVLLAVTDTGVGMDRETLGHIFEPFFTTKEEGKGTGLGLATVYAAVSQSGGHVWVYSEPGRGTTFKVYLPRVDEALAVESRGASAGPVAGGKETILLVEDEESLRNLAQEILEEQGYTLIPAASGPEALEANARHPGPIHLVLTDVVLPGVGGRELAEAILRARPGTRVVYMSGYTDDALGHQGVLESGMSFVGKPFTPDTLLRKVREALDAPGAGDPPDDV